MKRLLIFVISAVIFTSCFKETAFDTSYVIRVHEQLESSGDHLPLAMAKCYAFEGSTEEWEIKDYAAAEAGVVTSNKTGEQRGPFAIGEPYNGSDSQLVLKLDREGVIIVVVDPATQSFAYTDYTVPINVPEMIVDLVFRPWKLESFTAGKWTFVMPEVDDDNDAQ